jgi:hypothetical protein
MDASRERGHSGRIIDDLRVAYFATWRLIFFAHDLLGTVLFFDGMSSAFRQKASQSKWLMPVLAMNSSRVKNVAVRVFIESYMTRIALKLTK